MMVSAIPAHGKTPANTSASAIVQDSLQTSTADSRHLLIGNRNPWLRNITYKGHSFALVNSIIIVIVICFITMIILLLIILLNRNRMERESKLREYLLERYQGLIIDYLFGDTKSEQFLAIASDNFRR